VLGRNTANYVNDTSYPVAPTGLTREAEQRGYAKPNKREKKKRKKKKLHGPGPQAPRTAASRRENPLRTQKTIRSQ